MSIGGAVGTGYRDILSADRVRAPVAQATSAPLTTAPITAPAVNATAMAPDQLHAGAPKLRDYLTGGAELPATGWREAASADLSALGIRGENLSTLPGAQYARVFVGTARGEGRIALDFTARSGAWQRFFSDGAATPNSASTAPLISAISQPGDNDVAVLGDGRIGTQFPNSSASADSPAQSRLAEFFWADVPGDMLAFVQGMGRANLSAI
ncbi:MAG: hypothetical protein U5J78_05545 [Parasphingorhabdus sp.]|nr:hypothetical protein [Parasphingorhabdus sp.]